MISVTAAIEPAIERTKEILFRPFNAKKWFVLGFSAFLANLTSGGGSRIPSGNAFRPVARPDELFNGIGDWISGHLTLAVSIGLISLLLIIAFAALFQWLSSRGQFMFLDAVVHDRARIAEPWRRFRDLGNNLFLFRFLLGLAWMGAFAIIGLMAWLIARPDIAAGHFGGLALTAILLGCGFILISVLVVGVVVLLLLDFVVPIMYHQNLNTIEAFSVFRQDILPGHAGSFVLYYLMKLALGIAAAVVILTGTCLTCCLASLPYLSSVFFLPVFVFFRCYSLSFLEQFEDEWRLDDKVDGPASEREPNDP
jgi:hypothetical protein